MTRKYVHKKRNAPSSWEENSLHSSILNTENRKLLIFFRSYIDPDDFINLLFIFSISWFSSFYLSIISSAFIPISDPLLKRVSHPSILNFIFFILSSFFLLFSSLKSCWEWFESTQDHRLLRQRWNHQQRINIKKRKEMKWNETKRIEKRRRRSLFGPFTICL